MLAQGIPADSVRRALAEVFERPSYRWVEQPSVRDWVREQWAALINSLNALEQSNPALFTVILVALVVLLVVILVHIAYTLWRMLRRTPDAPPPVVPGAVAGWDAAAHFRHADELAAAGQWADALGHKFLGLVLELDRRRALRFHPSKTPAEYVGEASLNTRGRRSLADVVGRLYRHVFGAEPCDAAAYRAFGDATQLVIDDARPH